MAHHSPYVKPVNVFEHPVDKEWGYSTLCVHTHPPDGSSGAVTTPIILSSTFAQMGPENNMGYEYAREGNPTRQVLQDSLALLEGAKYGLCFSSGLGCNTTITHLLKTGDHILVNSDVYGGTHRYYGQIAPSFGIQTQFVDFSNLEQVKSSMRAGQTKMFWIETPSNPLLKVVDIVAVAALAKSINALVVVDNTFLSPVLQNPLRLGADIVVHSVTKYIAGHCDVVMGACCLNDPALFQKMKWLQNGVGAVPAPFDCYMTLRGLKTLPLRVRESEKNAHAVAACLAKHPAVKKAIYPGLKSHPQHELCKRQARGFGGVVAFYLKGPDTDKLALEFFKNLKVFTLAVSLGGIESLANHPFSMTHGSMPLDARMSVGITPSFIRLSIGVEDEKDLVNDLTRALDAVIPLIPSSSKL